MLVRKTGILLLMLNAGIAVAAPSADGGMGFHLEGKPAIDEVFGDVASYRREIDRFLELAAQMQNMREEFTRSVQAPRAIKRAHE
jgi:hypothetical protein